MSFKNNPLVFSFSINYTFKYNKKNGVTYEK